MKEIASKNHGRHHHDKSKETAQKPRKSSSPAPNYMKGTKCSEAKREKTVLGSSKLQRVPKTLTTMPSSEAKREKTVSGSSRLQRVPKTLTTMPSSEAKREKTVSGSSKLQRVPKTLPSLKRVRISARRSKKHGETGTCSSTQKEVKFPSELELDPGATQAQGGSVLKVCSYTHCSLNRHECTPVSWLKSFSPSKRRLWKMKKVLAFDHGQDKGSDFGVNDVNELSGESFDIESKEGRIFVTNVGDELMKFQHDEISELEWQNFSDVDSLSDCKSTNKLPGMPTTDEPTKDRDLFDKTEAGNDAGHKENMYELLSNRDEPDYKSFQTDEDPSEEKSKVIKQKDNTSSAPENDTIVCCEHSEVNSIVLTGSFLSDPIEEISETKTVDSSRPEFEESEAWNRAELKKTAPGKFIIEVSETCKEQDDSNSSVEVKLSGMDGTSTRVEVDVFSIIRNQPGLTKHTRSKFKRSKRPSNKAEKERNKAKEFNPRRPKFLPIPADPEAESVVLRHQEMDQRRHAEEWMFDYALRKAVNQLASVRRRNVALLVQAFEAVVGGEAVQTC